MGVGYSLLLVHPNGGRYWRLKCRIHGREKRLALGTFPEVSLAKARQRREDARRVIADNADPGVAKQAEKTRATLDKATWIFEQLLFPDLGDRPIRVITAPDLLAVLRKIEERGAVETAHRAKQRASQVFRYAIATGRASHDPAGDLRGALTPKDVEHRAAITEPKRVGELLRAIDGYVGRPATHYALCCRVV